MQMMSNPALIYMLCHMKCIRLFITSAVVISLFLACSMVYAERSSWEEFSQSGSLKAIIQPEAEHYQISRYHNWTIILKDVSGSPVENARIEVAGGMLGHGHGLPSQPVVTKYLGNGQYLIEGMLFNMSGEWTLNFYIQTPNYKDRVRFDIEFSF